MSQILILLRKSLLVFSRAKAALLITFVVPIVLIFLLGHVFGLYSNKNFSPTGIPLGVVNASSEPAAVDLVNALKAEKAFAVITDTKNADGTARPLTEADVRAGLHDNAYRFALILPADFMSAERLGLRIQFLTNPRNEIEAQMVNGIIQKTVFSRVPSLLGRSLQNNSRKFLGDERFRQFNRTVAGAVSNAYGGDKEQIEKQIEAGNFLSATQSTADSTQNPAGDNKNAQDFLSRLVKIESDQVAGKDVMNPMAARIVGGYAIMFLLFAVSGSASSMFEERKSGVFQRILASPVRPAHIVWARFFFGTLLGLVQITALFLAGRLFYHLEIFEHAGALFVLTLAASAACSAFGMLIAAIAPSEEAARGLSTFLVISMSAVGGAWFPVSIMPAYVQMVSKLTLVYWSVEGFTDVLWAGSSLIEVLPKIGVLAGIAVVIMSAAVWRFNRSQLFE